MKFTRLIAREIERHVTQAMYRGMSEEQARFYAVGKVEAGMMKLKAQKPSHAARAERARRKVAA